VSAGGVPRRSTLTKLFPPVSESGESDSGQADEEATDSESARTIRPFGKEGSGASGGLQRPQEAEEHDEGATDSGSPRSTLEAAQEPAEEDAGLLAGYADAPPLLAEENPIRLLLPPSRSPSSRLMVPGPEEREALLAEQQHEERRTSHHLRLGSAFVRPNSLSRRTGSWRTLSSRPSGNTSTSVDSRSVSSPGGHLSIKGLPGPTPGLTPLAEEEVSTKSVLPPTAPTEPAEAPRVAGVPRTVLKAVPSPYEQRPPQERQPGQEGLLSRVVKRIASFKR
jgi:hypothetical protein